MHLARDTSTFSIALHDKKTTFPPFTSTLADSTASTSSVANQQTYIPIHTPPDSPPNIHKTIQKLTSKPSHLSLLVKNTLTYDDSLTYWKFFSKAKDVLPQTQRVENLSWRLLHLSFKRLGIKDTASDTYTTISNSFSKGCNTVDDAHSSQIPSFSSFLTSTYKNYKHSNMDEKSLAPNFMPHLCESFNSYLTTKKSVLEHQLYPSSALLPFSDNSSSLQFPNTLTVDSSSSLHNTENILSIVKLPCNSSQYQCTNSSTSSYNTHSRNLLIPQLLSSENQSSNSTSLPSLQSLSSVDFLVKSSPPNSLMSPQPEKNTFSSYESSIIIQQSQSPSCSNCTTTQTPLWRRDVNGGILCNACGLFQKLHGHPRPIHLNKNSIKKRNRRKKIQSTPRNGVMCKETQNLYSRLLEDQAVFIQSHPQVLKRMKPDEDTLVTIYPSQVHNDTAHNVNTRSCAESQMDMNSQSTSQIQDISMTESMLETSLSLPDLSMKGSQFAKTDMYSQRQNRQKDYHQHQEEDYRKYKKERDPCLSETLFAMKVMQSEEPLGWLSEAWIEGYF